MESNQPSTSDLQEVLLQLLKSKKEVIQEHYANELKMHVLTDEKMVVIEFTLFEDSKLINRITYEFSTSKN